MGLQNSLCKTRKEIFRTYVLSVTTSEHRHLQVQIEQEDKKLT
jgi:hypothetical protein